MAEVDRIQIKFRGGVADFGRLHFYEYSRSQYALARFVSSIENFRRTGRVYEKIVSSNYVDIFVDTPIRGSFVSEIAIPALAGGAGNILSLPFSSLFSYVWDLLTPKATEGKDAAIKELARVFSQSIEKEKNKDDRTAEMFSEFARIAEGQLASNAATLKLLEESIRSNNTIVQSYLSDIKEYRTLTEQLSFDAERQNRMHQIEDEFSELDQDSLHRLTSRLRPMVHEIGLPLRRSAESLMLRDEKNGTNIVNLDEYRISQIAGRDLTQDKRKIVGVIRGYDKLSGLGKFQSVDLLRDLTFKVPPEQRKLLLQDILDAMAKNEVECVFRVFEDADGFPTSLVLLEVH